MQRPGITPYSDSFFDSMEDGALRSARVVVPILLRFVKPTSVIDVGCGRGAWLKAFQEYGVSHVKGLDGTYINRNRLLIRNHEFSPIDLTKPFNIDEKYDLALCLEVAEHLPPSMSTHLVKQLTAAAPFVLFSAAVPGQGGTNHINEQWPSYWRTLFSERGYVLLDPVRGHIWHNRQVQWWYRQNMYLYAADAAVKASAVLLNELNTAEETPLEWIHVSMVRSTSEVNSVRQVCKLLPTLVAAALRRRGKSICVMTNVNS